MTTKQSKSKESRKRAVASAVLSDGALVEMLFDPATETTRFAIKRDDEISYAETVEGAAGPVLVPYRADNPILRHGVVMFPSQPEEYGDAAALIAAIRTYIHGYVDLSPPFELLVAHYVLLTWVFDRFNEVPYLRLQGEYGTGKTRFLLVVGSICRTPIFAGGASTTAPLFHMLDRFGGTLLIDEADFRFSDETAQVAKILNNGNARGFPVLRIESVDGKEFRPRAYQVFGPKLIAMRTEFDDRALESRFITERSDARSMRADIPLSLPARQQAEALELRNKLLMFRFRRYADVGDVTELVDQALEPRINQVFAPLLSLMETDEARETLRKTARERQREINQDRSLSIEAGVVATLRYLTSSAKNATVELADIADLYSRAHARDLAQPVSSRWIGGVIRLRLGLDTRKSNGNYVVSCPPATTMERLSRRYAVSQADVDALAAFDVGHLLTRVEPIDPGGAAVETIT